MILRFFMTSEDVTLSDSEMGSDLNYTLWNFEIRSHNKV